MQKVIVQILRTPAGGIRKHVYDILEHFSDKDVFQIFITNVNEADKEVPAFKNMKVFHLDIKDQPGFDDLKNLLAIYNILRKYKVDVIHGHGAKGGIYARLISFLLRAQCIYTPHGGSLHRVYGKIKNKLYAIIELLLVPFTNIFLFESNYSYHEFSRNICDIKKKSIINYNGVEIPDKQAESTYHAGNKLRMASFGFLRHLKGHDIAIETCVLLSRSNIPFEYSIHGTGEENEKLLEQIAKNKLEEKVSIENYSESVEQEMLKYDFIIHPSRFESFGYVPVEAMALKIPVIVSWVGGLKEVVEENCGYISYENTAESYFLILKHLYEGDSTLQEKIDCAFNRVKKEFSKEKMLKKIEEIYCG